MRMRSPSRMRSSRPTLPSARVFFRAVIHAQVRRGFRDQKKYPLNAASAPTSWRLHSHRSARSPPGRAAKDNKDLQRVDAKALAGAPRRSLSAESAVGDEIPFSLLFVSLGRPRFFFPRFFPSFFVFCRLLRRFLFSFAGGSVKRNRPTESRRFNSCRTARAPSRGESDQKKDQQDDPNHFLTQSIDHLPLLTRSSAICQCSSFVRRLFLRREAAGIEDCAVVRHTELTVGFKPRHFGQFLKRPKVKIAQEFFLLCGTASAAPAPEDARTLR